ELCLYPVDLSKGAVLERGCIYLVPAMETLALPEDIEAEISPKSSSGRLDVLVRTISGESSLFDTVPAGYHGRIFIEIMPQTFPIRVRQGSRLCQIRFRRRSCGKSTATP